MSHKIAVTSGFGWPYVRRGNRVAYELAVYLASRGNEVHFITTKPGRVRRDRVKGNLVIKSYPLIDNPILTHFKVEYWQTFGLTCLGALLREDYDIVHTSLTMDAFAASMNRSFRGTPFVPILIQSDPLYKDARRAKRLFQQVVGTASRLVTISDYVNGLLKRDFGVEGVMIPCPVDTSKFYYTGKKNDDARRILCTAAITMERKRVPLLVKAFENLIEQVPDAILQLAGETTPAVTKNLLLTVNAKTRKSIEIVDITSDAVLSEFYRNAAITVLPSLNEAFGMVTTESLASGTPVVGTRSGGTAEILDDPRVGVLFEPTDGPEELCRALIKGIELSRDPETAGRCSEHAQRYSWNTLGPKYEELDMEVLNESGRRPRRRKRSADDRRTPAFTSSGLVPLNGNADGAALHRFFLDVLDEMEITAQTYYELESCMPRCVYILRWILKRQIPSGNVLVLSARPHFLEILLRKLNFRIRHIVLNGKSGGEEEHFDYEIIQDLGPAADLRERFDVIVCDDLLQHFPDNAGVFKILKKHLMPDGLVVLTAPNGDRYENRFNGRDTDACCSGNTVTESPQGPYTHKSLCHRRYSLAEVEKTALLEGFTVLQKSYIFGERLIDKTNTFAHVQLKTFFVQRLYRLSEYIAVSRRSHMFMALTLK